MSSMGGRPPSIPPLITGLVDPRLDGAACKGRSPWWDDLIDGESTHERRNRLDAAARICLGCPVRAACSTAAREHTATGLWAGHVRNEAGRPGRPKEETS